MKSNGMARGTLREDREKLDAEVIGATGLENVSTQDIYREIIRRYDADPSRDGLEKTPERIEKALEFLTKGYRENPKDVLHGALFDVAYDEMVIVKDIEMYSLCEHHMLPFFGKVHVAYIPDGKVIGLSKAPRLVEVFARRLQVQERLTRQIAEAIQEAIHPQGVGVVIEARHLCMMMRGVEKQNSSTVTSAMLGVFQKQNTRAEFLSLIRERTSSQL
jgi:GTP cyclohydrolase I